MKFEAKEFDNLQDMKDFINLHIKKEDIYNYQIMPYQKEPNVIMYLVGLMIIEDNDLINQQVVEKDVDK